MAGMLRRIALISLLAAAASAQSIVLDVKGAIARNDFALGENLIQRYKTARGVTPEMIEAVSWLGRGALAAKQLDRADRYAAETRSLVIEELKRRRFDSEAHLPLALGASIEVQAAVMTARGDRDAAVAFLQRQIKTYWDTSIRARIQKNIHLLSLEGKPAPPLDLKAWLGPKPPTWEQLKGKTVLLFFWAHWCNDCKNLIPHIARVASEYRSKGLEVIGPTQHYGYVAGGVEAGREKETAYIESVRKQYYAALSQMPAPLSEENFRKYGSSTSPTLVLVDRWGIVRLYHPGSMSYEELSAGVKSVLAD